MLRHGQIWAWCSSSRSADTPATRSALSHLLEDGDGADRAGRPTPNPEREAGKAETAAADQLFELGEAFDVRDAALGAGAMGLEIQLALGRGTDGLDAEHADALVCEPMHRLE